MDVAEQNGTGCRVELYGDGVGYQSGREQNGVYQKRMEWYVDGNGCSGTEQNGAGWDGDIKTVLRGKQEGNDFDRTGPTRTEQDEMEPNRV